jgi:hypothetical protein
MKRLALSVGVFGLFFLLVIAPAFVQAGGAAITDFSVVEEEGGKYVATFTMVGARTSDVQSVELYWTHEDSRSRKKRVASDKVVSLRPIIDGNQIKCKFSPTQHKDQKRRVRFCLVLLNGERTNFVSTFIER